MPQYQYSQNELDALATCAKRVSDPPRRDMKSEGAFARNDFGLESIDGQHRFKVFFRQNQTFPENFSLGLDYLPQTGGRFTILRVNGAHGDFNRSFDPAHPHNHPHVHCMTAEDLSRGILKPRSATPSSEYASFEQAVPYFVKRVNITEGAAEYFEPYRQIALLFVNDEESQEAS